MSLDPYSIVKYPIVTEKSGDIAPYNQYIFCVEKKANKYQIKDAIENVYNVKVDKVNVVNMPRKKKKYRFKIEGYKAGFKKAIVTLREGERIAIT